MRIPSSHLDDRAQDDQAMTPMIDVVFLLLIFFVCASVGQVRESLLPTELAEGSIDSVEAAEQVQPFGEVWLFLRRDDDRVTRVQINQGGREYENFDLLKQQIDQLAEATTEVPVILDIEGDVPYGDVIRVYDACYAARFETIRFAADAKSVAKPAAPAIP